MSEETNYVHEDATSANAPKFFAQRWVRITGVSLIAAVALVGAFGAGVMAGERISGGTQSLGDRGGFNQQFGGQQGQDGQGGPGGFPGGCPADDPDHCAGTDRGQHTFQLPQSTTAPTAGASTSGTSNP